MRTTGKTQAFVAAVLPVLVGLGVLVVPAAAEQTTTPRPVPQQYLVGRGISDATGEVAEVGLMGYGRTDQQAEGLHTRLRSRAFVIADPATGKRVLVVVVDSPMIFDSVRRAVLRRLAERYGDLYTEQNVLISGTHTHAGPGGYSHHLLYNLTTLGFHRKTFDAITDGIVESAERAHADVAPSSLTLTHASLTGASVNRSRAAFDRNPSTDKAFFPDAVDSQTSLLRITRGGKAVGAINWFPVHATSMSGDNRLVSADNKGYAAYHWEHDVAGVDYLADTDPDFVSAFAQTNAGDMSPNLDLQPPTTPEDFANTHRNGLLQYQGAVGQLAQPGARVAGGVDSRLVYVDLSNVAIRPEFTGDASVHRTCDPVVGASMMAGSTEDGPAFPTFAEGENPLWDRLSGDVLYQVSPSLRECQAPKASVVPLGALNKVYPWVQETVPVQLVRIGQLYLIGVPGEVTITAGLRLRQTVATIVGANLHDVLVAGYSNAYFHYLTTPEEYDAQQYEGGSTLFGRWQLPAMRQITAGLATAMRDGRPVTAGTPPEDTGRPLTAQPPIVLDTPPPGRSFGDVLAQPRPGYRPGEPVSARFVGAHPGNDLHRGGTHLEVQRWEGAGWRTVANDGDWNTTFHWARSGLAASTITIGWTPPPEHATGRFRIRYHGAAKGPLGAVRDFTGTTNTFVVQ